MATNVVMSNGASNKWVGEEYSPQLADQIAVMVEKEEAFYTGLDYLAALPSSADSIDEGWRQRAAEWMFRVVDFYDLDRDIVNVGMAYLDRMFAVSSLHLQWGEQRCNIITVASLKLAIKLFEPRALNLDDMVKLATKMGGGFHTPSAIIEMEQEMLWKFSWDVFPPTAFCFAHHMISILPDEVPKAPTKYVIQELAKYQSELAVCVYQFVKFKPSSVSLACCLVAIDNLDDDCLVSPEALTVFLDRVFDLFGLRHDDAEILFLMNELKELLCHNTDLKEFVALIRASNKPNDSEPSPKTAAVKTLSH